MRINPWFAVGFDAWALGVDASSVVALRVLKIASGGAAAHAEARQMISEKIDAGCELQVLAMTGRLGFTASGAMTETIARYRRKVRANRRRLAKS